MQLKSITLKEFTKWKSLFIQYKPVVFYVGVSLVFCPVVLFLLSIILSVPLQYADSDYPIAIFNLSAEKIISDAFSYSENV